MKLKFCVACGTKDDLQHHHLVMRSEGGSDDDENLITLCTACHHKVHERQMNGTYNHGELVRAGHIRAKSRNKAEVLERRDEAKLRKFARQHEISNAAVLRIARMDPKPLRDAWKGKRALDPDLDLPDLDLLNVWKGIWPRP
jgi:phage terminase large subunit GpA-like protein